MVDRSDAPQTHDVITGYFNRLGVHPTWVTHGATQIERVFDMVAIGSGIGWLNTWQAEREAGRTDVAIRPLQPIGMWDEFRSRGAPATRVRRQRRASVSCWRPAPLSVRGERTGRPAHVRSRPSLGQVTITGVSTSSPGRRRIRVGSRTFTFVLAMGMAVTALASTACCRRSPTFAQRMGLDADATEVAGLVTFFLMGSSAGLLPAGVLADRYGRRSVMLGGLVLYVAGASAAVMAPTLPVMFAARFVWGLGSAGPRVAAMAMIRDAYDGDRMAKQMSFMMAVFILVPTFAPAVSSGLLRLGPWQIVFWLCAVAGTALLVLAFRLARDVGAVRPAGALRRRRVAQLPNRARHPRHVRLPASP